MHSHDILSRDSLQDSLHLFFWLREMLTSFEVLFLFRLTPRNTGYSIRIPQEQERQLQGTCERLPRILHYMCTAFYAHLSIASHTHVQSSKPVNLAPVIPEASRPSLLSLQRFAFNLWWASWAVRRQGGQAHSPSEAYQQACLNITSVLEYLQAVVLAREKRYLTNLEIYCKPWVSSLIITSHIKPGDQMHIDIALWSQCKLQGACASLSYIECTSRTGCFAQR